MPICPSCRLSARHLVYSACLTGLRSLSTLPPSPSPSPSPPQQPLASQQWYSRRLLWLATGSFVDPPRGPSGEALLQRLSKSLQRLRLQRAERASLAKPIRVRESNVLAALREPTRLLEFNRPMPLPRLVSIMNTLWEEEAAAQAKKAP
jgi:hypothetical protein